jgi:hypothetical protein
MRKSIYFKAVLVVVLMAFVLEAGLMAYSMINRDGRGWSGMSRILSGQGILLAADTLAETNIDEAADTNGDSTSTSEDTTLSVDTAASSDTATSTASSVVTISAEVLELIRTSDPAAYDKNVANYKELLSELNVHERYQSEMENMLKAGKKLPDILIAYSFVNDSFGTIDEVKSLVDAKEAGGNWRALFDGYRESNPDFTPQSFESGYLEELLKTEGITKDDVMIADRAAQKLSVPFTEVMQKRIGLKTWKDINAEYGIVNGQMELPNVEVAPEKVEALVKSSGLTEQNVIQAFVIAYKLDADAETIIGKFRSGYTKTRIYAECLESKYK